MLKDNNNDDKMADKGLMEAEDNGGKEKAMSRARLGSFHCPPLGIRLPLRLRSLRLEAEAREVMVLASELEAASEEDVEVEVEFCQRFFSTCRCINRTLTYLRVFS